MSKKSLTLGTSNRMFSFLLARIKNFSFYLHVEPGFLKRLFFINNWKVKVLCLKSHPACLGEDRSRAGAAWCCSAVPRPLLTGLCSLDAVNWWLKPLLWQWQQGQGVQGLWGCLGTGWTCSQLQPSTLWCSEQPWLCGARGQQELLLPLGKATSLAGGAAGCAFLLPCSAVCVMW